MKERIKNFILKFKNIQALIGLIIIVLGIVLDQVTKKIVVANMELYQSFDVLGEFFQITYVRNTGAAWGMFSDSYVFLGIVTVIALCAFIYLMSDVDYKKKKTYSISVAFMISGTIGNLIDRTARALFNGLGVVDFLDFEIFGYDFPVFNIADILLVVGVILFAVHTIFLSDNDKKKFEASGDNDSNQDDLEENIENNNDLLGDNNENRNEEEREAW